MEAYEYQTLYEFEKSYWWYRHLHNVLIELLLMLDADQNFRILDAGCGTGQNMDNLVGKISNHIYGFDLSSHATPFWKKRNLTRVCNASINQIPYADKVFDYVVCVDVLECQEVREVKAIAEMIRVTKPGGYICLVVPAFDFLMSQKHNQAIHAIRRYTKLKLLGLFSNHQVQEIKTRYLFAPVFPLIVIYRWSLSYFSSRSPELPHSELSKLPSWLNWILYKYVSLERYLLPHLNLPFGSSIITIVQKDL